MLAYKSTFLFGYIFIEEHALGFAEWITTNEWNDNQLGSQYSDWCVKSNIVEIRHLLAQ